MNKTRREKLFKITEQLCDLKSQIEILRDEEQESFDALPDSLQASAGGVKSDEACQMLGDAIDSLEEADTHLTGAQE
ncbi:hypothetical protein UFOVP275_7 [uncultured Caudovirales phage]|uniref:Uncharacterized protein n=1 Tax=uncultured Caudovirales phage TaxID=2100421 RepID=A0A6J5LMZ0_9CAUD|nr:hypothetical protein UFOVP275_7 [uncultured Caudovirales phage]